MKKKKSMHVRKGEAKTKDENSNRFVSQTGQMHVQPVYFSLQCSALKNG